MQPLKKPRRPEREVITGGHKKKERNWILEYQWKSLKDWNKYPSYAFGKKVYDDSWIAAWGKYITASHAADIIRKDYRSGMQWMHNRYQGKNWRVRNKKTGETMQIEL